MTSGVTWSMSSGRPVVSNASPLIWLAKIGRLGLLKALFGKIIIPGEVHEEATAGGQADSIMIKGAIEEGWMEVYGGKIDGARELGDRSGVHVGEAEAILLAQMIGKDLIIDEREGSATAQIFGVRTMGTIAILLLALARSHMTFDDFRECLDRLTASGFWLSVDVYSRAIEEAISIAERGKA